VVECVLLALSVMASAVGASDNEETYKLTLKEYLSEVVSPNQFDKAWSNPLLSASMSTAKAERIIVAAQKELSIKHEKDHKKDNKKQAFKKPENDIEQHLNKLRDLLDRGLIEENEYNVARAKALEI
jgi:hypothetical protein